MSRIFSTRRGFLKTAGVAAGASILPMGVFGRGLAARTMVVAGPTGPQNEPADYSLTIATKPVELARNRIVSVTTYNGQFPGPLLRLKEGERVTIAVRNDTDTPEQLHWHGQFVGPDVVHDAVRLRVGASVVEAVAEFDVNLPRIIPVKPS